MHFATLILPLASLAHAILTPTPPGQKLYHLKTRAANTTAKNDLYVSAYHNGAGTNEVVLLPHKNNAAAGFLNGTSQHFKLGTLNTPFSFYLGGDDDYAEWQLTQMNGGYGDYTGWYFNANGGLTLNSSMFSGWLACDWWRGTPQLMWRFYVSGISLPCSCTPVDLVSEEF